VRFVHLHNHSVYSLLDGVAKREEYIEAAKQFDPQACCVTEHGNMFAMPSFIWACEKAKIKPIAGMEAYIAVGGQDKKSYHKGPDGKLERFSWHLTMWAMNKIGYHNLMKLSTLGFRDGYYRMQGRIDHALMAEHGEGIAIGTGCIQGEFARAIIDGDGARAIELISIYKEYFGEDNVFIELMKHGITEEDVIREFVLNTPELKNVPIILTNDVHYMTEEDYWRQDLLLAVRTGKNIWADKSNRMMYEHNEFWMKTVDELLEKGDIPEEWLTNTAYIADRVEDYEVERVPGKYMPQYPKVPTGLTAQDLLRKICEDNWDITFNHIATKDQDVYRERLEKELRVINELGFADYFLTFWDFVKWAGENNIPVGPGRGSCSGSLVVYLLNITVVDPIEYKLSFERFLNKSRVTLPDIDIDVGGEVRGKCLKYLEELFKGAMVAHIGTFNTYGAKLAIKEVARGYELGFTYANEMTKRVPEEPGTTIQSMRDKGNSVLTDMEKREVTFLEEVTENRRLVQGREPLTKVRWVEYAEAITGTPKSLGKHAAAVVITNEDLDKFVSMAKTSSKDPTEVTQVDMHDIEDLGFVKLDLLGLRTIDVIYAAMGIIAEQYGGLPTGAPWRMPLDDKKTFDLIKSGETKHIFQLSSPGFRHMAKQLDTDTFELLVALNALHRTGAIESGASANYIERRHDSTKIKYIHPELEEIFKDTYGIMLYQEQIMEAAKVIAGYTDDEADNLRRIIGKKVKADMDAEGEIFLKRAVARGKNGVLAKQVFEDIKPSAAYNWNLSHAVGYSLITYATAYLKAHYPLAYMVAELNSYEGKSDEQLRAYKEIKRLIKTLDQGELLPPAINTAQAHTTFEADSVTIGLRAIKGVGEAACNAIIEEREDRGDFLDFLDFSRRISAKLCNKTVKVALLKAGCFRGLPRGRSKPITLFSILREELIQQSGKPDKVTQPVLDRIINYSKKDKYRTGGLAWEDMGEAFSKYEDEPEYIPEILLRFEVDMLGVNCGKEDDRLSLYDDRAEEIIRVKDMDIIDMHEIEEQNLAMAVGIMGIVDKTTEFVSAKGNPCMRINIGDSMDTLEIVIFGKTKDRYAGKFRTGEPYLLIGTIGEFKGSKTFSTWDRFEAWDLTDGTELAGKPLIDKKESYD